MASALFRYPDITFGPRTHSSPRPPGPTSSPVAGSTNRCSIPGSANPQLAGFDLRTEARPELEALASDFGDTAFLMVPSAAGAVCIDRVEGGKPMVLAAVSIGSVLPYHAAAAPVAMAAFDSELRSRALRDPLPAFTEMTLSDPGEFASHLDQVRAEGVSRSRNDYLNGVSAVAAPILGSRDSLVGTISLGGHSEDFTGSDGDARAEAVRAAAKRLSDALNAARP